jgi:hypothetical protein
METRRYPHAYDHALLDKVHGLTAARPGWALATQRCERDHFFTQSRGRILESRQLAAGRNGDVATAGKRCVIEYGIDDSRNDSKPAQVGMLIACSSRNGAGTGASSGYHLSARVIHLTDPFHDAPPVTNEREPISQQVHNQV